MMSLVLELLANTTDKFIKYIFGRLRLFTCHLICESKVDVSHRLFYLCQNNSWLLCH